MTAPPPPPPYGYQYQYPYPYGYPPPDTRLALTREMDALRERDPRPWGARPVIVPLLTLVALVLAGGLISHLVRPDSFGGQLALAAALTIGLYAALGVAVRRSGDPIASRYGGWGVTFGLRRPRWMDLAWIAAGIGMVFVSRIVIALIAVLVAGKDALEQSQNLDVNSDRTAVYVLLAIVVVGLAPVIEETVFRGLLLRTFYRRIGFWPAALASSAIFAGFHLYEVSTLAGAAVLGAITFALGMTNCMLVWWSGRLFAGIVVHMLFNALALTVLIVQNT
jgi:membrane protease YdiL (CAAX protease family)